MTKFLKNTAALAIFLSAGLSTAQAESLTFTSWGGTTQDAQATHWAAPFSEATGIAVNQDGPTDYGKIKAMVEADAVTWDVVDTDFDYAAMAGQQGLLEPLDFSIIDKSALDPRFVTDYAVGSFYFSFVIGYNNGAYAEAKPVTLTDFFDLEKFPGKRTVYKWAVPGMIEAALIADGVKPEELYPLDLDRAFKKFDSIKSEIIWWTTGAQSQQLLASGEAPLGLFWNGRVAALLADGQDVAISWEQNITAADALVVPKGTKNRDAAMKFIAQATSAEGQAAFATETGFSPVNTGSAALMDEELRKTLPDNFTASQINTDMAYWAEHREEIGNRWYAWQAE